MSLPRLAFCALLSACVLRVDSTTFEQGGSTGGNSGGSTGSSTGDVASSTTTGGTSSGSSTGTSSGSSTGTSSGSSTGTTSGGSTGKGSTGSTGSSVTTSSSGGGTGTGIFVVVGYGGRTIRSQDDGASWTDDTSLMANDYADDHYALRTVMWDGQQFIAYGWRTMTSPDGQTWKDYGDSAVEQWFGAVLYAQSQYVSVGGNGLRDNGTDGINWLDHSATNGVAFHLGNALVFDSVNNQFAAANDNGTLQYTADGKTWKLATGASESGELQLASGGGVTLAVGGTNVVVSSDGGTTWTAGASLGASLGALIYAQGHFTAVANDHVYTSDDGQAWVNHAVSGISGTSIAFGDGTYVLMDDLLLRTSTDGLTWNAGVTMACANSDTCNHLDWVTFGASN